MPGKRRCICCDTESPARFLCPRCKQITCEPCFTGFEDTYCPGCNEDLGADVIFRLDTQVRARVLDKLKARELEKSLIKYQSRLTRLSGVRIKKYDLQTVFDALGLSGTGPFVLVEKTSKKSVSASYTIPGVDAKTFLSQKLIVSAYRSIFVRTLGRCRAKTFLDIAGASVPFENGKDIAYAYRAVKRLDRRVHEIAEDGATYAEETPRDRVSRDLSEVLACIGESLTLAFAEDSPDAPVFFGFSSQGRILVSLTVPLSLVPKKIRDKADIFP